MSTPVTQPRLGAIGGLRWFWRQLTSMRTALFLLLILAVAAVPGSIFPQRSIDAARTNSYLQEHATIGPWLDRLGMFDVFSSPWFAAIYLLLIVSLIGCIVPRIRAHARSLRSPVPRVPARLERLRASTEREVPADPADLLRAAREVLGAKRYRLRQDDVPDGAPLELAAEGGRLRETGNLLFHTSLVIVIIAVAFGHLLGFRGDVIVPVGQSFSNTATRYDTQQYGPWMGPDSLEPWTMSMDHLDVQFEHEVPKDSPQWGQPRHFVADVTTTAPSGPPVKRTLGVNEPVAIGGADVYLLGNGYAPDVTVRDAGGRIVYSGATPFLPQDNMYRSVGAVKVSGLPKGRQLGFFGFFLPTAAFSPSKGPYSQYPDLVRPALVLGAYEGDLFGGSGPQSVYTLDTSRMTQLKDAKGQPLRILLTPGQTYRLPDGRGTISFGEAPRWAGLSVRSDPGKTPVLIASLLALTGLIMSMVLRRRRIFLRVAPVAAGASSDGMDPAGVPRSLVTIGGLAKGEDPRLQVALDELLDRICDRVGAPGADADNEDDEKHDDNRADIDAAADTDRPIDRTSIPEEHR